jgi:hypothetical protein
VRIRWPLIILLLLLGNRSAFSQDKLIYCNEPERIRDAGAYASAYLEAGTTYTIFYHYRNDSGDSGDFVLGLRSIDEKSFSVATKQGLADPDVDPPTAGRQAMARFLRAGEKPIFAAKGTARFAFRLGHRQVASGMLTLKPDRDLRLRIYFKHDQWDAPRMRTIVVDSPRCDIEIPLSESSATRRTYRIGMPELTEQRTRLRDGSYGMLYAFKINAPEGSKVRISFSPRGGKAGLVGMLAGDLVSSAIFPAFSQQTLADATVGPAGHITLTTSPFGGVFYPVEVTFQLL